MDLKWVSVLIIVSLLLGASIAEPFFLFFKSFLPQGVEFVALNPSDGFMVLVACGLLISLIFFMLVVGGYVWVMYSDALYKREREFILKNLVPSGLLFLFGNVFGFFLYTQIMLNFFIGVNNSLGVQNYWSLYSIIISGLGLCLMLGLAFQLPLVIRGLIKSDLIKVQNLKEKRLLIVFIILLVAGLVTPTPDVFSQLVVGLPLYGLFELSLLGLK